MAFVDLGEKLLPGETAVVRVAFGASFSDLADGAGFFLSKNEYVDHPRG